MAESETTKDVVAGWIGGAVGILISNPLEVLKVRLQTGPTPAVTVSRSPSPVHHCSNSSLALKYSIPPSLALPLGSSSSHHHAANSQLSSTFHGLKALWRQEGYRFLFAGAAAPIIGLAFIDAFFFATYGKCMSLFSQDRDRPDRLPYVFASGAFAGGCCALLQTPIEVIKCRAQAEQLNKLTGLKMGSYDIAAKILRHDGLRGFYLGGLMTGVRDSISSGIFFTSYAIIRGLLARASDHLRSPSNDCGHTPGLHVKGPREILQIMIAGALSGTISALLPYPLDLIKTRLQVNKLSSSTSPKAPNLTIARIIREIYADGKHAVLPHVHHTRLYSLVDRITKPPPATSSPSPDHRLLNYRRKLITLSLRLGGLTGFFRGLKPTLISSFVGSGITMGIFEYVFQLLGSADTKPRSEGFILEQ